MRHGKQEEIILQAMRRMSPQKSDFYLRIVERIATDKAFVFRLEREYEIFEALFRANNFAALERWFARKTLEVVAHRQTQTGRRLHHG